MVSTSNDVRAEAMGILDMLVGIASENPGGNELGISKAVMDLLHDNQVPARIVARDPTRPNVIATLYGGAGPTLILQSHLDTKPAMHAHRSGCRWNTDPFQATHSSGRVYGLGTADTKGGAATQLAGIVQHARKGTNWRGTVIWQGVADEENGSIYGAKYLLDCGLLRADMAVVSEPTDLTICTSQLGQVWVRVMIDGVAGHAGTPWAAISATDAALAFALSVQEALASCRQERRFLEHPRLNIGAIRGGYHPGTVPGSVEMLLDIRVLAGETRTKYLELLQRQAAAVGAKYRVSIELSEYEGGGGDPYAADCYQGLGFMERAWERSSGSAARSGPFPGGSDARFFGNAGTPAFVFGPGSLSQAHALDEFVEEDEVAKAASFITCLLEEYLGAR
jgi:succinyl-diaminopimelate desuccinylase